jgi:hypothetical protein
MSARTWVGEEVAWRGEISEDEEKICEGGVMNRPGDLPEEETLLAGSMIMECAGNCTSSKITFREI